MIARARSLSGYLHDVPSVSGSLRKLAQFDADVAEAELGPECLNAVDLSEPGAPSPEVQRLIGQEIRESCRLIRQLGPHIERRRGPID